VDVSALGVALILVGVATTYGGPGEAWFDGRPLYCGCGATYDVDAPPWVAVDVSEYESGRVRCGDELWMTFEGGGKLRARAMDAGYLYGHDTLLGGPIVVDVPAHLAATRFDGLARVRVVNHSAARRELERYVER